MSLPVQSSSFGQVSGYQPEEQKKEEQTAKEVEVLGEVPTQEKSKLEKEFSSLMSRYYATIEYTAGLGDRGQHFIDAAWKKLVKFVDEHPSFKSRVPKSKSKAYDDGNGGISGGLAAVGLEFKQILKDATN